MQYRQASQSMVYNRRYIGTIGYVQTIDIKKWAWIEKGFAHSGTECANVLHGVSGTRWFAWDVRAMNAARSLFKLMIKVYCRERRSHRNKVLSLFCAAVTLRIVTSIDRVIAPREASVVSLDVGSSLRS